MCKTSFERKRECLYTHSNNIAEWWNTISNIPFIVFGIMGVMSVSTNDLTILYILMIAAGFASGIHHAMNYYWTILLDWFPITLSIMFWIQFNVFSALTMTTWFMLLLSFTVLLNDHVVTTVPVPWGHVMWHVFISFSVVSAYKDYEYYYCHHLLNCF